MTDKRVMRYTNDRFVGRIVLRCPAYRAVIPTLQKKRCFFWASRSGWPASAGACPKQDLAARIGAARSTVQLIEKGAPSVAVGLVFEAATIAGVDLFVPEATTLAPQLERTDDKLALMPRSIRKPASEPEFDDDF